MPKPKMVPGNKLITMKQWEKTAADKKMDRKAVSAHNAKVKAKKRK